LQFSFDFDSVWIVPLGSGVTACGIPSPYGPEYGVPLSMHRMSSEYLGVEPSLLADVLLREEPEDEEEEDEENDNDEKDDDDGDDGYSE
jgi:hypothetical protein